MSVGGEPRDVVRDRVAIRLAQPLARNCVLDALAAPRRFEPTCRVAVPFDELAHTRCRELRRAPQDQPGFDCVAMRCGVHRHRL